MCLILYVPKRVPIRIWDWIRVAWEHNPHGAGYAIWSPSAQAWLVRKGLMSPETLTSALRADGVRKGARARLVLHLRMASAGAISEEMTHPHEVRLSEGRKAWLFHNGHVSALARAGRCVDQSDTARLANELKGYSLTEASAILRFLSETMGAGRFALCVEGEPEPVLVGTYERVKHALASNTYSLLPPLPARKQARVWADVPTCVPPWYGLGEPEPTGYVPVCYACHEGSKHDSAWVSTQRACVICSRATFQRVRVDALKPEIFEA